MHGLGRITRLLSKLFDKTSDIPIVKKVEAMVNPGVYHCIPGDLAILHEH
jgi:hypothetical protein